MTDTLFDLPDSPSPRLEWMRRHGVTVNKEEDMNHTYLAEFSDKESAPTPYFFAYGCTEHDALVGLAKLNNLKLWNEE